MSYTYEALSPGGHQEMLEEVFSKVREQVGSYKTASGSLVSFNDGADLPMPSFICNIDAVQDLHGYDAPWVGGAGKNKLQNTKTTKEIKGVTFTVNSDGSVTANGIATAEAQFTIPIDTSTVYGDLYFVGCSGGSTATYNVFMWDNTTNSRVKKWDGTTNAASSVDGTLKEIKIVQGNSVSMVLRIASGYTANNLTFKPMIRLSTETDSTFAPYSNECPIIGWSEANVSVCGKNIATTEIYKNNYVLADDGAENYAGGFIITKEIKINSSNNYYISMVGGQTSSSDAIRIGYFDGNFNFIRRENESSPTLLSVPDNAEYIRLSYRYIDPYFKDIQIEVGNTATAYEPYNGQTYTIDLDGTRYGGTLDVTSGVLTVDRGMLTLNGSEAYYSIQSSSADDNTVLRVETGQVCNQNENQKSNYGTFNNNAWQRLASRVNTFVLGSEGNLYLQIPSSTASTVEEFKALFASNPLQVCYELATPQTYQLTPTQVKSIEGENNISANCGQITEVKYFKRA